MAAVSTSGSERARTTEALSTKSSLRGLEVTSASVVVPVAGSKPSLSVIRPWSRRITSARVWLLGSLGMPTLAPSGKACSDLYFFE
ncbi:Uncharacterised protein [Achromobacter ruhlandii]|nr:Uncharacterised protein [Achromobacter ruhlandii]